MTGRKGAGESVGQVANVVDKKTEGGEEILRRKAKGGEQVMESSVR